MWVDGAPLTIVAVCLCVNGWSVLSPSDERKWGEDTDSLFGRWGWERAWISKSLTSLFDVLISSLPSGVDVLRSTPSVSRSKASCHRGFDDDMKFTSCLCEGTVDHGFYCLPSSEVCLMIWKKEDSFDMTRLRTVIEDLQGMYHDSKEIRCIQLTYTFHIHACGSGLWLYDLGDPKQWHANCIKH